MNDTNVNVAEETISFYVKIFFQNFQMPSADQLTNMVTSAMSFADCFEDLGNDKKVLKTILDAPIKFVLDRHSDSFSSKVRGRLETNFSLGCLEWIYFRDTKFRTPLKTEYYADSTRPTRHLITLKDIVTFRGFLKAEISSLFSKMAKTKGVQLKPDLLGMIDARPLQQMGEM